jgi:hypothetical protein
VVDVAAAKFPGIVPIGTLLLGRTDQVAVAVTGLSAFSAGIEIFVWLGIVVRPGAAGAAGGLAAVGELQAEPEGAPGRGQVTRPAGQVLLKVAGTGPDPPRRGQPVPRNTAGGQIPARAGSRPRQAPVNHLGISVLRLG